MAYSETKQHKKSLQALDKYRTLGSGKPLSEKDKVALKSFFASRRKKQTAFGKAA